MKGNMIFGIYGHNETSISSCMAVPFNDFLVITTPKSFIPHQTRLQSHRHSFFPRTIPEWNALPETIIQAPSIQVFKTALQLQ